MRRIDGRKNLAFIAGSFDVSVVSYGPLGVTSGGISGRFSVGKAGITGMVGIVQG
jgi:hypothetical protein